MPYAHKLPKDCAALLEQGWTYLDVRTPEEFEQGHPKGAFNVPVMVRGALGMQPNPEFPAVVARRFAHDAKLVVGCASGVRSVHACEALQAAGYAQLVNMECGWNGGRDPTGAAAPGWQACGLPAEGGHPAGRSYADLRATAPR